MNDAERTLLALADPINWTWNTDHHGQERWEGKFGNEVFYISPARRLDDVDTLPDQRGWWLHITRPYVPVATVAQAKAFCLRYVLTGDDTEIRNHAAAVEKEKEIFHNQKRVAYAQLMPHLRDSSPVSLAFEPGSSALEGHATIARGTYHVHFDPSHRWVVRFTDKDNRTDEQRFVTRNVAEKACTIHAARGQWYGTLEEFVP